MAVSSSRQAALEALLDRQGNVTVHLDRLLAAGNLPPAEAALASELAHGVVRRRRTLDAIIRAYSTRPGREPPPAIREILRLGVYQLVFLDRIPVFAAVNESVGLCRRRHARQAGYVNALLRAVSGGMGEPREGPAPLEARVAALEPRRYRRFERDVCADPQADPAAFLADYVSLPDDLAGRWLREARNLDDAVARAMQVNARPPIVARVDRSRTTVEAVLADLAAAGAEAVAHANGRSIVFTAHVDLAALDAFRRGLITPQDPTATAALDALGLQGGRRVLDLCAAPGTKTIQAAEAMERTGRIVAVDVSEAKLQRIAEAARRCGADLVETCPAERVGSLLPESFDAVIVDAPCSNTGVLARRIEARWRFRADQMGRLAADQRRLLEMASLFCAPGGSILYSTCSIEPEENDRVVQAFCRAHPRHRVVDQRLTRPQGFVEPQRFHDGGFWAVVAKDY
ncbi:MAG: methyltransferase domain-containing protein [Planctomycetes bacterium]|nr:methyltransferase domain-containing protein [Planctomycetota bacterium]